jgi:bacillithiol system protein YtxJ
MNWHTLENLSQLDEWLDRSQSQPVLFFKHSTRCSISAAAYGRMERGQNQLPAGVALVYLDLLAHRDVSNALAEKTGIAHESPQLLLVVNRQCVFDASHFDVRPEAVKL